MQKNDFEKQVQQQLEDFSIPPGDAVWQKVSERIGKNDKRRRLALWLFAAILVLGGGSTFLLLNNIGDIKTTENIRSNNSNQPERQNQNATNDDARQDEVVTNQKPEKVLADRKVNDAVENKIAKRQTPLKNVATNRDFPKPSGVTKSQASLINLPRKSASTAPTKSGEIISDNAASQENSTISQNKVDDPDVLSSSHPSDSLPKENIQSLAHPSTPSNLQPTKKPMVSKKQWQLGLMIVAGASDNSTSRLLPGTRSADLAFSNNPSPIQSSQPSLNYNQRYNYTSSFSYGAGAFLRKEISKHASIQVGLGYQQMAANLATGARVDSIRIFYDSVLQKTTSVASFFRGGENSQYKNRYHLLQVPLNFLYRINSNPDKPLNISAGFTAGLLIGSNALYLNDRSRIYYRENNQFNRLVFGAQAGLSFTVYNSASHRLQLEPLAQYQISNLTKPVVNSNEHLLFLGLKGNLLFKNLNK